MAEEYLIDTSVVIKYLNESFTHKGILFLDGILDKDCTISFITEIELQVWNPPNPEDIKVYNAFVDRSTILGVTQYIIQETIQIRKQYRLKLPDALIVGTSICNNKTLIADNDKDFGRVPHLKYMNPHNI